MGDVLAIQPNTLVFSIDDTGDERMNNRDHPIFAFGGVACVSDLSAFVAERWRMMKAATFPQVRGPLHAKVHLRERLAPSKRAAVLAAVDQVPLARFGSVLTSTAIVPEDAVVRVACSALSRRLEHVADGMIALGLWSVPGPVVAIFEHSQRLEQPLEDHFPDRITVRGHVLPIKRCFMPKSAADPFLEMADFVSNAIGRNINHQIAHGRAGCTADFKALFRDVGPPRADYIEVSEAIVHPPAR